MDRDEFLALPPAIALRVIFDALDEEAVRAIGNAGTPTRPKCPKYDQMIFRQGGVQWASETDLDGLRFWHGKALEPPSDPKYVEANKKRAASLERWIAWREWYPDAAWSGERDGKHGVAKRPSAKPTVYPRPDGNGRPAAPPQDETVDPENW